MELNFYDSINGKTIQSDKEKVKFIGTNSLLPRLLFFKDKNFDDEHSIFCYEELNSILDKTDDKENIQFRKLRRFLFTPYINSSSEFTKYLLKSWNDISETSLQIDIDRINNLYLYYLNF